MSQLKQVIILIFLLSLAACGGGGSDTAGNNIVDDPGNTTPLPGDAVWNTSNWDEKNWK